MPEVRSLCLSSLLYSRSIPCEGDHPSGRSRPPLQVKANGGRLQPGMGGRLQTESVVAFERNGWSPWTGIRTSATEGSSSRLLATSWVPARPGRKDMLWRAVAPAAILAGCSSCGTAGGSAGTHVVASRLRVFIVGMPMSWSSKGTTFESPRCPVIKGRYAWVAVGIAVLLPGLVLDACAKRLPQQGSASQDGARAQDQVASVEVPKP